jgi:hypothetical protein
LLDRQLFFELRLQLQLARVVALLLLAGRDERPPSPGLEAVDPVNGLVGLEGAAVEAERGGEELASEAAILEFRRDRVDAGDLVLELGVADDDPLKAERVGLAVKRRAGALRDALEQLVDVALRLRELAGRERLEDRRSGSRALE